MLKYKLLTASAQLFFKTYFEGLCLMEKAASRAKNSSACIARILEECKVEIEGEN